MKELIDFTSELRTSAPKLGAVPVARLVGHSDRSAGIYTRIWGPMTPNRLIGLAPPTSPEPQRKEIGVLHH